MDECKLLKAYEQYNALNSDKAHPKIKILVSYIKPFFLFKTDILTPIHLGRAVECAPSKDGVPLRESLEWLHANCLRDDDFDGNISWCNRRVGFFTGTYWAWKNYSRLGNPIFFGSFGCRKLLSPRFLESLDSVDLVVPRREIVRPSVREQLDKWHGHRLFDALASVMTEVHPDETSDFENYFSGDSIYWHELYVMRRDLFFRYCEWLQPVLERLLLVDFSFKEREDRNDESMFQQVFREKGEMRDIAFIIERVTGYWLSMQMANPKIRGIEVPYVEFGGVEERMQWFRVASEILRRRF